MMHRQRFRENSHTDIRENRYADIQKYSHADQILDRQYDTAV